MEELAAALSSGPVSLPAALLLLLIALIANAAGGAVGGIMVGGEHLDKRLAAMMGAFFGPVAALPGVLVALAIPVIIGQGRA